jgi:hypothetical protein
MINVEKGGETDLETEGEGLGEGTDGLLLERGEELLDQGGGRDSNIVRPRLILFIGNLIIYVNTTYTSDM